MFSELSKDWKDYIGKEILEKTHDNMSDFLEKEYENNVVYPARGDIFNAFNLCSPSAVKVVILGQDPYHGEGEAQGLAFSVRDGVKCPPSLRNILNEVSSDLQKSARNTTDLSDWAGQGVLLLNTILTVKKDLCNSHRSIGWEYFTSEVIKRLGSDKKKIVFILWGKPAEKFEKYINAENHLIIKSAHPSPLSSYRGFFGSKPFSRANEWLKENDIGEIDW